MKYANMYTFAKLFGVGACVLLCTACASKPPMQKTGFVSDYSRLEVVSDSRLAYRSPELAKYHSFIVDPVQIRVKSDKLSEQDQAEAARYFREKLIDVIAENEFALTDEAGAGTARVRIALTDIAKSTWWAKIHPMGRAMGAGTGGASMEAEVIDSVTGEQLGAVIQSGSGNQFNVMAFATLTDVKSAIDSWADRAGRTLAELRAQARDAAQDR
jgi:hypothetical protein